MLPHELSPGDEETHREKPESDGLVGRIDVEV
jgi:hypothetical protein